TTFWLNPEGWEKKPVILVNNKTLKEATGLPQDRKLFSYEELAANTALLKLFDEAQALRARPGNQRLTGLPKDAAEVGMRIAEFEALANGSIFRFVANPTAADGTWVPAPGTAVAPLRTAFLADDQAAFNQAAETFRT